MAAVQFHCPHCRGMFQVDSSLAGVQVSCPHCRQVTTVPDVAPAPDLGLPPTSPAGGMFPPGFGGGSPAPPQPSSSPFDFAAPSSRSSSPFETSPFGSGSPFGKSPSRFDFLKEQGSPAPGAPSHDPFAPGPTPPLTPVVPTPAPATSKFSCPLCQGLFQVSASMAGQQVTCPHCRDVVTLPAFGPAPSPSSGPPVPAPAPMPPSPPGSFPPPSGGAKSAPTTFVPPSPAAAPSAPTPSMYPPGYTPPGKGKPVSDAGPKPVPSAPVPSTPVPSSPLSVGQTSAKSSAPSQLYPPGFSPPGAPATTSSAPVKAPVPSAPVPSTPAPDSKPAPSSPPPEKATSPPEEIESPAVDIAALLPPSSGPSETLPTGPTSSRPLPLGDAGERQKKSIDELLPPGVEPAADSSGESEGLAAGGVVSAENLPEGVVVLPASDGGFIAVREQVKTVKFGGEEVELRKLTPEEKARKRAIRTIIMAVFGVIFLTVIAVVLVMLNG